MSARRAFAAIVLAAAALYGMSLNGPPLYDEATFITYNPIYSLPFGTFLARLFSARYMEFTGLWTFQLIPDLLHYFTHGWRPGAHLLGVLVHGLDGFLVYLLARELAPGPRNDAAALLAGLFFVLYPPLSEAVNIAAFLGHELALAFTLACLLSWIEGWEHEGGMRTRWLAVSHGFFVLGLFSKETAAVAPALIAAHTLCFAPREWRRRARSGAGLLVLLAAYLAFRFLWLKAIPIGDAVPGSPQTLVSFGWYLRMLAVPAPLCLERTLPSAGGEYWLLLCLPALLAALLYFSRRSPFVAFCLLWLPIACAPFLHTVGFANYSPVADRYLATAAPGICLFAAHPILRGRLRYGLFFLAMLWGVGLLRRNAQYLEPDLLFTDTAACAPRNPRAQAMLGALRLDGGDPAGAADQFERAAVLDPAYVGALNGLALARLAQSRPKDAEAALRAAVAAHPEVAFLHRNLADVLKAQGKSKPASVEYAAAEKLTEAEAPLRALRSQP